MAPLGFLALLAVGSIPCAAQEARRPASRFFPDSSHTAQTLLRAAANHGRDGQWAEALDLYDRVVREFSGTVALVPPDEGAPPVQSASQLYVDVREECNRRLAALPPEALALYRRRVDAQAERLYREAKSTQDPEPLRRITEEMFASSWTDDALLALGDWAFRTGRFGEAISHYRRLVPAGDGSRGPTVVPDPELDPAAVEARIVLSLIARSDESAPQALTDFAARYPEAKGLIAGRSGLLKDSLAAALKMDKLSQGDPSLGQWSTFAGSPSRSWVAPHPIDVGSLQWRAKLEPVSPSRPAGALGRPMQVSPLRPDRGLAYHPIIIGEQVVLCDANRLFAFNLNDRPGDAAASESDAEAKVAWSQSINPNAEARAARPIFGVPRFTVTGQGDRIFARLGPLGTRMGTSFLVAVQNNRDVDGKLIWRRASSEITLPQRQGGGAGRFVAFEGTPVADDRSVYVGLTEPTNMTALYVACLDARTGSTRWVRFLGEATPELNVNPGMVFNDDTGNRLLTLEGGTLYYQTNLGVLAALEAETGAIRWLAAYPHREGRGGVAVAERELNPAVAASGLVMVAPSDSTGVMAFDAATGRLRWRNEAIADVSHVLGVSHNRLVVTGSHVYFLDVETGRTTGYWPQGAAGYPGYGRGILAGDFVYWPTRTEIHVIDVTTELRSDRGSIALQQAFGISGGNLALGDGYLVVAQEDGLVVLCQNSRLIDRLRQQIVQAPDVAAHRLRLARIAEATGQEELALESLRAAIELAQPGEMIDGRSLVESAQSQRFRLLMRAAEQAAQAQDWEGSAQRYLEARQAAQTDRDRLSAALQVAETRDRQGRPAESISVLQGILTEERLRNLPVAADAHRTVRADLLIADRLDDLLSRHGRGLYDAYEARASQLLERGRTDHDPRLLEEIARQYPAATIVPGSLLELGAQFEAAGLSAESTRAFKRLLARSDASDEAKARALLGLGRVYESQQYWVPARDSLARAANRYRNLRLEPNGPTVGEIVAGKLAHAPFDSLADDLVEPPLDGPLERLWSSRWPVPAHPIGVSGIPPSGTAGRIFLVEGTSLQPIEPTTGRYAWTAELGGAAIWACYLSDRVVAATDHRLVALDARTGVVRWSLDAGESPTNRKPTDPFAQVGSPAAAPTGASDFTGFRLAGGRIFCLRGTRELVAVDGDSGLIDWSFSPAKGELNPHYHLGTERVVLQVREPNALVVLESETGLRLSEFPQAESRQPWPHVPLSTDDEHLAVVTDSRTVELLDLSTGGSTWIYREPSSLPRNGSPRLLGDASCLLVLRDGSEVVRLNPGNGNKLWSRVIGVEDLSDAPDSLALDGEALYCASGQSLTAYRLSDGSPLWRRHLTGTASAWNLSLVGRCIVAVPASAQSAPAWPAEGFPVILCRRETGRLIQRLYLGSRPIDLIFRFSPNLALVATQEGGWALTPQREVGASEVSRLR